jgi:hypothetical protein
MYLTIWDSAQRGGVLSKAAQAFWLSAAQQRSAGFDAEY